MSKRYLIKLTPTGKYFFGGDIKFSVENNDKKDNKEKDNGKSSYIVESAQMPQQTSLLGMMRFLLLSNNEELFDINKNKIIDNAGEKVKQLIGEKSFTVNEQSEENKFGKIKSLGPCFIYHNEKCYSKSPLDKSLSVDFDNIQKAVVNGIEVEIPLLKKSNGDSYTGKDYLDTCFVAVDNIEGSDFIKEDKENPIFKKDTRIGIDKNYEGKTKDSAFYKQISYRLRKDCAFAFEVEVDKDIDLKKYNGKLVKLGADSSMFIFEAGEKLPNEINQGNGLAVVLLSNAYIDSETIKNCKPRYAIAKTIPFRFLKTEVNQNSSFYRINGKNAATTTDNRYELYESGSVFYFSNENDRKSFCEALENRKDFNQIGYNKYYIKK